MKPKCICCGKELELEDKELDRDVVHSYWLCRSCKFELWIDFDKRSEFRVISGNIYSKSDKPWR